MYRLRVELAVDLLVYRLRVGLAVDEFLPQLPQLPRCLHVRYFHDEFKVADAGKQRQRIHHSSTAGHFRLVLRAYIVTVARGVWNNLHFPAGQRATAPTAQDRAIR